MWGDSRKGRKQFLEVGVYCRLAKDTGPARRGGRQTTNLDEEIIEHVCIYVIILKRINTEWPNMAETRREPWLLPAAAQAA